MKMKIVTRKALEGSIKKWEKIVDGTEIDKGIWNCPLCDRFWYPTDESCEKPNGEKCPVYEATGKRFCKNTPYYDWEKALKNRDKNLTKYDKATDDETVMCAVLEVEFLKSLLPKKG